MSVGAMDYDTGGGEPRDDAELPIEDLFSFGHDPVDFMSAGSFPASDPPPAQSAATSPAEPLGGR